MKTLVSFLGRRPKGRSYDPTAYDFGGGEVRKTSFFGLALLKQVQPDRLVVLGTAGSMWDVLVEHVAQDDELEDERLALVDAAEKNAVRQAQLDELTPLLKTALGKACHLSLIPYGHSEQEQINILRCLARDVGQGDSLVLDLTHGLRHLPMLGLVSALYLQAVRGVQVESIYYGAHELKQDDVTPVLRLDGLLRVADWIKALAAYDHSGDYSVFGPLLAQEGLAGDFLGKAAFYERTLNPEKARQHLSGFPLQQLESRPIGGLFGDALAQRIAWYRQPERSDWEGELAWIYFEKGDYVRCAAYAYEALATRETERAGGDIANFTQRNAAMKAISEQNRRLKALSRLRNELVHGVRNKNPKIKALVDDEGQLKAELKKMLTDYLPKKRGRTAERTETEEK